MPKRWYAFQIVAVIVISLALPLLLTWDWLRERMGLNR